MAGIKEEKKIYLVGIYCRLSKDDGTDNESASIATQKSILADYVKKQGWHLAKTYVDDTAIIRLNQKTFCLRGLPIKSYFFTLFTHPHLPRGKVFTQKTMKGE